MINELTRIIEMFGKEKGIDTKLVVEAIESAMVTAAKRKLGPHVEIEARFNLETGEIEIFQFKTVVEEVDDEDLEISFEGAQKDNPGVELGDSIGIKLDSEIFGRIAAQTAKQVISQKMRDAEREIVYSEFLGRKGEIISGIVRRFERGTIVIDLGKTEAFMPPKEQIPSEQYKIGDRVQAYLLDVLQTPRGPQIILSRATPLYIVKLFEMEVPEIFEGIVTIKSAAREPGARAKIAVQSRDSDVDPVSACVGMRGSRVQNIVQELKGERIDVIPYNSDVAKFVCSALSPAEVSKVLIDEDNKYMEVVVPDSQLSLAIGRKGQNVRLASQIIGWKIDVLSEMKMAQRYEDAKFSLTQIAGVSETMATALFQNGFQTIFDVAEAKFEDLMTVPGIMGEPEAQKLVAGAKEMVNSGKVIVKNQDEKFTVVAKKTADELLREEMQQLLAKEQKEVDGASSADDELMQVRGMGPSLLSLLKSNNISSIDSLTNMKSDEFLVAIPWDNKDELKKVYNSAYLLKRERMLEKGEISSISEEEKEKFKKISGIGSSLIKRLNAAGIMKVEDIVSSSLEDFIQRIDVDAEKAKTIYESAKNLNNA
jgi:transcription termination/antitermination protein NusA